MSFGDDWCSASQIAGFKFTGHWRWRWRCARWRGAGGPGGAACCACALRMRSLGGLGALPAACRRSTPLWCTPATVELRLTMGLGKILSSGRAQWLIGSESKGVALRLEAGGT